MDPVFLGVTPLSTWSPDEPPPLPRIPDIELFDVLGQGGMGVVYRGRQPYIDRAVAVKLLLPKANVDRERFAARFRREARLLAALSHPHIVACYQAGVTDSGDCYLAMEFIQGTSLQSWLKTNGPMSPPRALEMTAQIAEALDYARQKNIIHRDVKPDNVLLQDRQETTRSGTSSQELPFIAKLADLGLAVPFDEDAEDAATRLTAEGMVVGTPATMAPEQIQTPDKVDWRADVYGLGCTLFHALTGQRAYPQRNLTAIAHAKFLPPPAPSSLLPQLSHEVCLLVQSMLAVSPQERPDYATIVQSCRRLAAIGGLRQEGDQACEDGGLPTVESDVTFGSTPPARPQAGFRLAVIGGALTVILTAAWWFGPFRNKPSGSPSAPPPGAPSPKQEITNTPAPPIGDSKWNALDNRAPSAPNPTLAAEDITPTLRDGMMGWTNKSGELGWGLDEDSESTSGLLAAGGKGEAGQLRREIPSSSSDWEWKAQVGQLDSEAGLGVELPNGQAVVVVVQEVSAGTRIATVRIRGSRTEEFVPWKSSQARGVKANDPLRVSMTGSKIYLGAGNGWLAGLEAPTTPTLVLLHARGPVRPTDEKDLSTTGTRVMFTQVSQLALDSRPSSR